MGFNIFFQFFISVLYFKHISMCSANEYTRNFTKTAKKLLQAIQRYDR